MSTNPINGPSSGTMPAPPPPREFSMEQKSQIATILSKFEAESLTTEDARIINRAFLEAGFKGGPGLRQAIEEAGFDAETIRKLDPPPEAPPGGPKSPQISPEQTAGLNKENLTTLQNILSKYDSSEMSSDQESALFRDLERSGLLIPGLLINTTS